MSELFYCSDCSFEADEYVAFNPVSRCPNYCPYCAGERVKPISEGGIYD